MTQHEKKRKRKWLVSIQRSSERKSKFLTAREALPFLSSVWSSWWNGPVDQFWFYNDRLMYWEHLCDTCQPQMEASHSLPEWGNQAYFEFFPRLATLLDVMCVKSFPRHSGQKPILSPRLVWPQKVNARLFLAFLTLGLHEYIWGLEAFSEPCGHQHTSVSYPKTHDQGKVPVSLLLS